jgi:hypothetical protein
MGPTGSIGPTGPKGDPGKTAIVAWRNEYLGLMCVESPQVRFEDVMRVRIQGEVTTCPISREFYDICELNSLEVVGVSTPIPTVVGVEITDNLLQVRIAGKLPEYVTVKVSGIRAGRQGVRFPRYTEDQMHKNDAFWRQAHQ